MFAEIKVGTPTTRAGVDRAKSSFTDTRARCFVFDVTYERLGVPAVSRCTDETFTGILSLENVCTSLEKENNYKVRIVRRSVVEFI